MNKNYAKIITSTSLDYAPNPCVIITHHHDEWDEPIVDPETGELTGDLERKTANWDEKTKVYSPTAEQYLRAEGGPYLPVANNQPEYREGFAPVRKGYEEQDGKIVTVWEYEPIPVTQADYDVAMEDHIRQAREERGYTTREPSDYLSSSVQRWAQDAADFVKFRDAVMLVGLRVINEYAQTGVAPSLAEFRAMLPKCEWTYAEEA